MSALVQITLPGGQPWGFRIQGGYTPAHPVRISRVTCGGKAEEFGVEEGDIIDGVNGQSVSGLSHVDVQQLIRNAGDTLILTLKRPISNGTLHFKQNREVHLVTDTTAPTQPRNETHDREPAQVNIKTQDFVKESLADPHQQHYSHMHSNVAVDSSNYRYPITVKKVEDGDKIPDDAIFVNKKVIVEGDKMHTDSYYALPVINETVSTTTVPAQKYEGIGPTTVEGIPVGLRTGIKEEHASNWYKTMFKSLNKAPRNEDKFHSGGYVSEPDLYQRGHSPVLTSVPTDSRKPVQNGPEKSNLLKVKNEELVKIRSSSNEELGKSKYNVPLRPISEYEPGHSSIVEREALMRTNHITPSDKPFFLGTDGYDSDSTVIKKSGRLNHIDPDTQKALYREIQRGGDIPITGLRMQVPQKPQVYIVGPPPPLYSQLSRQTNQVVRKPERPPPELGNNFSNYPYNSQAANVSNSCQNGKNQRELSNLQEGIPIQSTSNHPQLVKKKQENNTTPDEETIARVLYDFKPQNVRELMLQKGDVVKIRKQLDKNWYEGSKENKVGIFPVTYVEIVPPEYNQPPSPPEALECKARAKFDFYAQTSVELPLKKGDLVSLLRQVDQNWFEGMVGIKKGIFPISYVEVLDSNSNQVASAEHYTPPPPPNVPNSLVMNCRNQLPAEPMPTVNNNVLPPTYEPTPQVEQQSADQNLSTEMQHCEEDALHPLLFRALYPYNPQNRDELELQEGDTISVIKMCDDGWYVGTSHRTGLFGTFPGNYAEKV